jgi:hypothetical protein
LVAGLVRRCTGFTLRHEIKDKEWQTVTDGKSILRQRVEEIDGVSRAWFEWILEDSMMGKILVVEVEFDTDPSDPRFRQSVLDAIENTIMELSKNETTAIVGHLRIVPKGAA